MTTAAHPRPRRPLASVWRAWVVVRPLVIAALLGAFATFLAMGGTRSSSGAEAQNIGAGIIDAIRVGDSDACTMATPAAQREIARMLDSSSECWTAVRKSPLRVRAAAMRPFLAIVGIGTGSTGGGQTASGSHSLEFSRGRDGRYAVIRVSSHGDNGYLVDSIRVQRRCADCHF
jgi:hypothetical protein